MIKLSVIIPVYNQEGLILKAIHSISPRDDVEVIVVDDCSTDETLKEIRTYQQFSDQNIVVLTNEQNYGVGYSVNRGIDVAQGEYITLLGSDDYFNTWELDYCIDNMLDGTDLIYYDLEINDGSRFHLCPETKMKYCGSTKFMRREFVGKTREPLIRAREDYYFYNQLLEKEPSEKYTDRLVKYYNFPRKDSLTDLAMKGKI